MEDRQEFDRIVADLGNGQFAPVSSEEKKFSIKANTINRVRRNDVNPLIISSNDDSPIGPGTKLAGIRLTRGDELVAGLSLFDDWQRAPIESNHWFLLPNDIEIPEQLVLVKASRPTRAGATHFTLGPAESMTLRHFIVLLTPLANDVRVTRVK
jgi:hypothetical protein